MKRGKQKGKSEKTGKRGQGKKEKRKKGNRENQEKGSKGKKRGKGKKGTAGKRETGEEGHKGKRKAGEKGKQFRCFPDIFCDCTMSPCVFPNDIMFSEASWHFPSYRLQILLESSYKVFPEPFG